MNKIINQFRRLYDDKGYNDHDFSEQEANLQLSQFNLSQATKSLVKASERLNTAALNAFPSPSNEKN
jgi:hypothetical protein